MKEHWTEPYPCPWCGSGKGVMEHDGETKTLYCPEHGRHVIPSSGIYLAHAKDEVPPEHGDCQYRDALLIANKARRDLLLQMNILQQIKDAAAELMKVDSEPAYFAETLHTKLVQLKSKKETLCSLLKANK